MLRDTAHIQEKDAEFLNKRREHRQAHGFGDGVVEPLYTMEDAERTVPLFRPVPYHEDFTLASNLRYTPYDAGHILGSSYVELHDESNGAPVSLAFSGDIGRPGLPIMRDPEQMPPPDYLIMESTYGGRLHKSIKHVVDKLADVVNRTAHRGGRIIVPAFALGRTQQLVLMLHELANQKRIPNIPIFVDSPLAINVTEVTRKHAECFAEETAEFLKRGRGPLRLQPPAVRARSRRFQEAERPARAVRRDLRLRDVRAGAHSAPSAQQYRGPAQHRADHRIPGGGNAGAQARGKMAKEVRIFGEPMRVRAEISSLDELSGHADQAELMEWIKPLAPRLRKVFLVHGEPQQAEILAKLLHGAYGLDVAIAAPGQSFEIN